MGVLGDSAAWRSDMEYLRLGGIWVLMLIADNPWTEEDAPSVGRFSGIERGGGITVVVRVGVVSIEGADPDAGTDSGAGAAGGAGVGVRVDPLLGPASAAMRGVGVAVV